MSEHGPSPVVPWADGRVPPPAGADGRPGWLLLTTLVATGPVVWMVHLAGASALSGAACEYDARWSIDVLTILCAVVIGVALWVSARLLARHRPGGPHPDQVVAAVLFLAVAWNAISLLVTLAEGAANLVIGPCPW